MRLLILAATLLCSCSCSDRSQRAISSEAPAAPRVLHVEQGRATYYARQLNGRRTASGERLNINDLVAAHPKFPFGTIVHVTNVQNGLSVDVRIVDRGPVPALRRRGVIIDLSPRAARELHLMTAGHGRVKLEVLRWGEG
jgi:peptidoglycan lytic transglycosylase